MNMKKFWFIILLVFTVSTICSAQRYGTKKGKVMLVAGTPLEKIEGLNKVGNTVIDLGTKRIEFAVLIKSFTFEQALMQEHFNENYMESSKYPKAIFKGTFTTEKEINLNSPGTYELTVQGDMTIHGVTKKLTTKANLTVKDKNSFAGTAQFQIKLADYNIDIPSVVKDKIAKEAKITVDAIYTALKK